ncbi:hypothetical protein VTN96DRAFT_4561 [Rasamsonia emersonii]
MLLHESRVRLHTGDRCGWVIEGSHPALTRIVTSIHFTALSQKWTSHGCIMSTPRWTRRRGCEGIIGRSEGLIGKGCQRSGDLDGPSSSLSIVILLRHTQIESHDAIRAFHMRNLLSNGRHIVSMGFWRPHSPAIPSVPLIQAVCSYDVPFPVAANTAARADGPPT